MPCLRTANIHNGKMGLHPIIIDINRANNFWREVTLGPNATSYDLGNLAPGTAYSFDLTVDYANGSSDGAHAAATTMPLAPSNLQTVAISTQSVDLTWTNNSNNETGFRIAVSLDGGTTWSNLGTVGANVTSFNATGLKPGTHYLFKVRAADGDVFSDYSNVVSVLTKK